MWFLKLAVEVFSPNTSLFRVAGTIVVSWRRKGVVIVSVRRLRDVSVLGWLPTEG